jgi:phospholipid/cholesterol/gamma-HCH transport system substrate-binding protein
VPAATPLVRLLRALGPVTRGTRPIVTDLQSALPSLRRSLEQFPALAREVVPSVRDTTDAVRGALPVFAALRPYAPDFVNGFFNGFGGAIGGYYDANGQYARIAPLAGAGVGQGIASLFTQPPDAGSLIGYRKGLVARCPGGASEPAPDGSNPFVDDPALCVPAQDHR